MFIRPYHPTDQKEVLTLIKNTIQMINRKDYGAEQIAIWSDIDETKWSNSLDNHVALVALEEEQIIGFGDMTRTGYIDRFYIHHEFQGQGIGKVLLKVLEQQVEMPHYSVAASITALPFFESQGYQVLRENHVILRKVEFLNYLMKKVIT